MRAYTRSLIAAYYLKRGIRPLLIILPRPRLHRTLPRKISPRPRRALCKRDVLYQAPLIPYLMICAGD